MKKVVAIVALMGCMVVGNSSLAQDGRSGHGERAEKSPVERAEKMTEKMKEDLKLNDEQVEEIKGINTYHAQEMEEIKRKMKALKNEARAERKAHQAKVNEVLTDEQRKLHEAKMAERKEKRDGKKKGCDHPKPE